MARVVQLGLLALIAGVLILGGTWLFREPLLRAVGISFNSGSAAETTLEVPDGYEASIYASGLGQPRFMAVAGDGTLLVADPGQGQVVALPDHDGDGQADDHIVVGSDYDSAHSLAFAQDGSLLVAGTSTL